MWVQFDKDIGLVFDFLDTRTQNIFLLIPVKSECGCLRVGIWGIEKKKNLLESSLLGRQIGSEALLLKKYSLRWQRGNYNCDFFFPSQAWQSMNSILSLPKGERGHDYPQSPSVPQPSWREPTGLFVKKKKKLLTGFQWVQPFIIESWFFFFFKQSKLVFFNFLLRASSKYMSQCGLSLCWVFFPRLF